MAALKEELHRCIDKKGSEEEEDLLELFNDLGAYRYCDNAENKGNKDSDEEGKLLPFARDFQFGQNDDKYKEIIEGERILSEPPGKELLLTLWIEPVTHKYAECDGEGDIEDGPESDLAHGGLFLTICDRPYEINNHNN